MADVIVDCTELYNNPVRTGIQRVVREMLRHWPSAGPRLNIVRFDGTQLVPLPGSAVRLLTEEPPGAATMSYAEIKRLLAKSEGQAVPARLPERAVVLIAEVFFDAQRAQFHQQRAARLGGGTPLAMLAYDFMPFLSPELFRLRSAAPLMGYLEAIRAAASVAHISAQTRKAYLDRIIRDPIALTGPVLPLGADGLSMERQAWRQDRRNFVCLGSIDGRKNQHLIAAGFMALWQAGVDAPLVLIGRAFEGIDRSWLAAASAYPQFRWLEEAKDADIARELRLARATIYASTAEGFGLPPVESLQIGIPVIASASIPSLEMLPPAGQYRLAQVTAATIAGAVADVMQAATAERLWAEAAQVHLPSWRDFGQAASEWIAGVADEARTLGLVAPAPPGSGLVPLQRLEQIAEISARFDDEIERIPVLINSYLDLPRGRNALAKLDPFSQAYVATAKSWLETITGRADYQPGRDELAAYMEHRDEADTTRVTPSVYTLGDSAFLGDMMQAFGAVLVALKVSRGHSVLEYGPGDGQIALALARMGCDVTVVDIEKRYLSQIRAQAGQFGVAVTTIEAAFGTAEPGRRYDRILFFEAFHHALHHHALLPLLRRQLEPGGAILFAGEPILALDNYFRRTLPYAWGPRLDGLSLRAMQACGWCELGFTREYFIELLMRAGFIVTFIDNPSTSRRSAYRAEVAGSDVPLGAAIVIEAVGLPNCWHPGDGEQRFMRATVAGIPINGADGWMSLSIEIRNHLPLTLPLVLEIGETRLETSMAVGERRVFTLPVPDGGDVLTLTSDVHRPSDLSPASQDGRFLGLAVANLRYHRFGGAPA